MSDISAATFTYIHTVAVFGLDGIVCFLEEGFEYLRKNGHESLPQIILFVVRAEQIPFIYLAVNELNMKTFFFPE